MQKILTKETEDNNKVPVYIDTISTALDIPFVKDQIKSQWEQTLTAQIPNIILREKEISSLKTHEIGDYLPILREAKQTYLLGFFYSTISMAGIAAEKFSIELSSKLKFKINDIVISQKELFCRDTNQYNRLKLLKKAKLLNESAFKKLDKIRDIRNRYVHPKAKINPEADSKEALNLMIDTLNERFSEEYSIQNGKLVKNKVNIQK